MAKKGQISTRRSIKSPDQLQASIDAYIQQCQDTRQERPLKNGDVRVRQTIPSMVGLAVYLGMAQGTLYSYLEGKYDDSMPATQGNLDSIDNTNSGCSIRYSDILLRARDRFELALLDAATSGDLEGRIAQARLARYGYAVRIESEHKGAVSISWQGVDSADADRYSG